MLMTMAILALAGLATTLALSGCGSDGGSSDLVGTAADVVIATKSAFRLPATPKATNATKANELVSKTTSLATALGSCHPTFMLIPMFPVDLLDPNLTMQSAARALPF